MKAKGLVCRARIHHGSSQVFNQKRLRVTKWNLGFGPGKDVCYGVSLYGGRMCIQLKKIGA